jgi:peptidoglycan/xylan/chitin deacetylase (PgdA/CDA1 family)
MPGPIPSSEEPGETDVLALCYHAVSPRWPADLSVTPHSFANQVEHLARHGYRGVTFTEAALGKVTGKCVAITFDDGYLSTIRLARPTLDRFGMVGTLFVPTDYIGGGPMIWPGVDRWMGSEHEAELMPMSWEDVRELADSGWEIGSHTKSHPHLPQISDQQLEEELVGSRLICEQVLERPCPSIAYPYGDHDGRVIAAAERAGYAAGATVPQQLQGQSPYASPRVGIYHSDGALVFRLKISPLVRRARRSRAWAPLADAARRLIPGR